MGTPILLPLILLLALALRLYGMDWDQEALFHPDERAILMKVGELRWPSSLNQFLDAGSPLNSHWFPYGSFPLYLLRLVVALLSGLFGNLVWVEWRLVGRALSALFDTGTVLLVFLLGRRLYGQRVGLLGAAFTALAVLGIQLSHFYAVDTLLTFFVFLCLFFLARVMEDGGLGSAALAGLALGLALASKVSAAPLLLAVAAAPVLYVFKEGPFLSRARLTRAGLCLLLTLGVAAAAFLIVMPYALLDWKKFLADTLEQSEMVRRIRDYPYTKQYIDTPAYWYPARQLAVWGLGLPLGLAAWLGLAVFAFRGLTRRSHLLLLSWVLPYFLITGGFQVKFLRYFLPMTPALLLMAAWALLAWRERASGAGAKLATWAIALVLGGSLFYSLAYLNIYRQDHPAVRMSRWVQANVPAGAVMLKEHWEEGIPGLGRYQWRELPLYNLDNADKRRLLAKELAGADYLFFYSNRLYGTISRLPERYPLSTRYYQALFSGELGYELEHAEASYPNLLGVAFPDDTFSRPALPRPASLPQASSWLTLNGGYADESFTVYDHPLVMLFGKKRSLSPQDLEGLLSQPPAKKTGLMLSPTELQAQKEGGTWSRLFPGEGFGQRFPVLAWLLLIEVLSLAALPLALALGRSLGDRGYLLAKGLGLLLPAYLTWLAASLRVLPFSRQSFLLSLLVVALVSAAVAWRQRRELRLFLARRWSLVLVGEGLFLGAFFLFYALRLLNPDLWHPFRGGEKPMDFAYLNAVVRSEYMPPYDPWFSGGYLNYYYYGQFLVASLSKVTGIAPSLAYNLAVPLFFALTVGGAFSLAYNLAHKEGRRAWIPYLAGGAGALFVAVLGNIDGLVQVGQGALQALFGGPFPRFDFWRSSRMMPPNISITEFPFFTFLFADLHAHLISLPFTIVAAGLALALARQGGVFSWGHWALLAALALVLGALRLINTWDFPTYFLLAVAALALTGYYRKRRFDLSWAMGVLLRGAILFVLSYLLYLPFQQRYEQFYSGFNPTPERTPLQQYLAIHSLFLYLLLSLLSLELLLRFRSTPILRTLRLAWEYRARLARLARLETRLVQREDPRTAVAVYTVAGLVLTVLAIAIFGYTTVAFLAFLLGLILLLFFHSLARGLEPGLPFALALAGLALAVGLGVELFTLRGDIQRMNTVFKFYLQAWVLLGVVAAYALARLGEFWLGKGLFSWGKAVWLVGFSVLFLGSGIYPLAATPVRLADRFQPLPPTLDGMAYMKTAVYGEEKGKHELVWDYEAIRWLQEKVEGTPVIVEGVTPLYRWGSRVSIYTGLPTVLGWDWHQKQQRGAYHEEVERRRQEVNAFYSLGSEEGARAFLRKYGVSYVYVGQLERLYYPQEGLAKFEGMAGLELAYENPGVRVYRFSPGLAF